MTEQARVLRGGSRLKRIAGTDGTSRRDYGVGRRIAGLRALLVHCLLAIPLSLCAVSYASAQEDHAELRIRNFLPESEFTLEFNGHRIGAGVSQPDSYRTSITPGEYSLVIRPNWEFVGNVQFANLDFSLRIGERVRDLSWDLIPGQEVRTFIEVPTSALEHSTISMDFRKSNLGYPTTRATPDASGRIHRRERNYLHGHRNSTPLLDISQTEHAIVEGERGTYTVKLTAAPTGGEWGHTGVFVPGRGVTPVGQLTLTPRGNNSDVSVSPSTLNFTHVNWMTEQTVTVEVSEDSDATDENVIIEHEVAGYGGVTRAPGPEFAVEDDDSPGITISPPAVQNVAEGSSVTYTLWLTSSPTEEVTVTPRSDNADVTFSPVSVTFDHTNWMTEQTVTVQVAEDGDVDDESVIISHDVVGYGEVTGTPNVEITVRDNDSRGVSLSDSALTIVEGGSASYELRLDATPIAHVSVTPRSDNPDVTLSPENVTFTPDSWSTPQTVTVRVGEDDDVDDETATISHEVANYGEVTVGGTVTVTVKDNDTTGEANGPVDIDVISGGVATGTVDSDAADTNDRNDWYRFALPTERTLTLRLTELTADADLCLYEGSIQIVSVEAAGRCHENRSYSGLLASSTLGGAASDSVPKWSLRPGTYLVRVDGYSGGPTGYRLAYGTLAPPEVNLSTTALMITKGSTATYAVVLTSEPSRNVTVTPTPTNANSGVTVAPARLIFTSADWNTAQTVTVTASEGAETTTIGHVVRGLFLDDDTPTEGGGVEITVTDSPGVILSDAALSIEEGTQGTYTLTLAAAPDGDVTVTPQSANPHVEFAPSSLTFSSENWDTSQRMTFIVEEENQHSSLTITHSVSGYGSVTDGGTVAVTVTQSVAPPVEEVERAAVSDTLAAVTASTVSNVTTNIGTRFSAARGGTSLSLAGQSITPSTDVFDNAAWSSLGGESHYSSRALSSDDLLRSTDFQIVLGAVDGSDAQAGSQVTVWGRGDLQYFRSEPDRGSSYDGDLRAGYLGVEMFLDEAWLAGVAVSRTNAGADYDLGIGGAGSGGKLGVALNSVLPYVRFAPDADSELWAILGAGQGTVENSRPGSASVKERSNLAMWMTSAGGRHAVELFSPLDWALLGDVGFGQISTADGVQAIAGLTVETWQARMGVEGSYTIGLEQGGTFTPFMEVAARYDGGGDGEAGLEVSPGLFMSDADGFGLELRGRFLVLHSAENYEEHGVSATLSMSPRADGSGLSMSLSPRWGDVASGTDALWRETDLDRLASRSDDRDALSLDAQVGYGVRALNGLVTPFGEFGLHDSDSRRVRIGTRFNLGDPGAGALSLELSGERREALGGDAEHRAGVTGRVRF